MKKYVKDYTTFVENFGYSYQAAFDEEIYKWLVSLNLQNKYALVKNSKNFIKYVPDHQRQEDKYYDENDKYRIADKKIEYIGDIGQVLGYKFIEEKEDGNTYMSCWVLKELIDVYNKTIEKNIEGINVRLYDLPSKNNDGYQYVVYKDKLYIQSGSRGGGMNAEILLRKKSTGEEFWVPAWDNTNMKYVISNHGFMKI